MGRERKEHKPANISEYQDFDEGGVYWDLFFESEYKNYFRVTIFYKLYGVHRIIFFMHNNYLPKIIDHIDGNPKNNNINNLREANNCSNMWNSKLHSRNTSKYKNVIFRKDRNKWTCRFKVNGKNIMRGAFNTAEEANLYAINLRNELHGEFANHG